LRCSKNDCALNTVELENGVFAAGLLVNANAKAGRANRRNVVVGRRFMIDGREDL
jgi:hypothetical protein